MFTKLTHSIKSNALVLPAVLVLLLIIVNTAIIYYNDSVLKETTKLKLETERAIYLTNQVWNQVVRNADIGMRGFALTKSEGLLSPLIDGSRDKPKIFEELREITSRQKFPNTMAIDSLLLCADQFLVSTNAMVELVRKDSMRQFLEALNADPGKSAWQVFQRNSTVINNFENAINEEAVTNYKNANTRTVFFQTLIFLIAVPTLLFMIFRIVKDKRSRDSLFLKLEMNNRDYLFNPGNEVEVKNEDAVIENSIKNFKTATHFISQVSAGNFEVEWTEVNRQNEAFNKNNLAGQLIEMRDRMKTLKVQDEIRNRIAEGLANFSDVIRSNQESIQSLSFDILVYLTKYLDAQQSCLFVLQHDEEEKPYLEMTACYAFDRKKHISKRIDLGQGLIGQTFLEGQSVLLTDIPSGYTEITSGLGDSTPTCLLVVPMKYNEKIEAVIEIAGFRKFEKYEIEFIEKVGEITASTLGSVKNTEKMKQLVEQFSMQTEQLKAQEEELRQNIEEMEATQESQKRRESEN